MTDGCVGYFWERPTDQPRFPSTKKQALLVPRWRSTSVDFEYAKLLGATIKLLGTAKKSGSGISVYVGPVVVPNDHPVASARGATNIVATQSANLASTAYIGPGAGRYPTANSVMSDIYRVAEDCSWPMG